MGRITQFVEKLGFGLRVARLRVRVILGVSLILILVMGLFTYYDMVTRTDFHFKRQEARAYEIADTVMRSIEYPMLDGEMMDVQAILERLNTLKDVTVINLCDATGTVKHSGLPANIGGVITYGFPRRPCVPILWLRAWRHREKKKYFTMLCLSQMKKPVISVTQLDTRSWGF